MVQMVQMVQITPRRKGLIAFEKPSFQILPAVCSRPAPWCKSIELHTCQGQWEVRPWVLILLYEGYPATNVKHFYTRARDSGRSGRGFYTRLTLVRTSSTSSLHTWQGQWEVRPWVLYEAYPATNVKHFYTHGRDSGRSGPGFYTRLTLLRTSSTSTHMAGTVGGQALGSIRGLPCYERQALLHTWQEQWEVRPWVLYEGYPATNVKHLYTHGRDSGRSGPGFYTRLTLVRTSSTSTHMAGTVGGQALGSIRGLPCYERQALIHTWQGQWEVRPWVLYEAYPGTNVKHFYTRARDSGRSGRGFYTRVTLLRTSSTSSLHTWQGQWEVRPWVLYEGYPATNVKHFYTHGRDSGRSGPGFYTRLTLVRTSSTSSLHTWQGQWEVRPWVLYEGYPATNVKHFYTHGRDSGRSGPGFYTRVTLLRTSSTSTHMAGTVGGQALGSIRGLPCYERQALLHTWQGQWEVRPWVLYEGYPATNVKHFYTRGRDSGRSGPGFYTRVTLVRTSSTSTHMAGTVGGQAVGSIRGLPCYERQALLHTWQGQWEVRPWVLYEAYPATNVKHFQIRPWKISVTAKR